MRTDPPAMGIVLATSGTLGARGARAAVLGTHPVRTTVAVQTSTDGRSPAVVMVRGMIVVVVRVMIVVVVRVMIGVVVRVMIVVAVREMIVVVAREMIGVAVRAMSGGGGPVAGSTRIGSGLTEAPPS